jgi:hypothetical protein
VQVDLDRYGLRIDGNRKLVRAGALHYFRLPSKLLWRDRLEKMRQAGLNAVELCYPWSYHSEGPGDYDFTGVRDIDELHALVEELDFYLIARPGPYVGGELDLGGLPAWILRDPAIIPRCRDRERFVFSVDFLEATRDWFAQVVPRVAACPNLILVQIENEYTVPGPCSGLSTDLWDLGIRWFGSSGPAKLLANPLQRSGFLPSRNEASNGQGRGQSCAYIKRLYALMRDFGVRVPIFHNDLSASSGRQMDVDLLALDRYPITRLDRDWRDDPRTFDQFSGDEAATEACRAGNPVFYAQLQAGWHDGWSGPGYERVRELLGPESIDNITKAALVEGVRLWSYSVFCGGTTWGYMSSPDAYSAYDCAAPVGESGRTGASFETVRRLNEFIDRFEEDLVEADRVEPGARGTWCPQHLGTRQGPERRFVFLRNATAAPKRVPTPEAERSELAPWETQIRVYGVDKRLQGISPEPTPLLRASGGAPPPLPRLESWSFAGASPQLDPAYDDSSWTEIPLAAIERDRIDIDALGVHYGFVWYRGTFQEPLDRLLLDARHCYAAWINRKAIAVGDQFQNRLGVGPDGARARRIPLRGVTLAITRVLPMTGATPAASCTSTRA